MILNVPSEIHSIMKQKHDDEKLDRMFGLAFVLMEEKDNWDKLNTLRQSDLDRMFESLQMTLKSLLKLSNEALGISDEFSRIGINKLLSYFINLRTQNKTL